MSDAENKTLREWLDEMLGKGFIQPSKSPVASACFFVPKKDSKDRLVIDYRKLNDITIPESERRWFGPRPENERGQGHDIPFA